MFPFPIAGPARRAARALGAVLALALLASCAALPGPTSGTDGDGFSLTGRFSVRQGKEGGSGRIQWRHRAADDELLVTSPIGQGIARITRTPSAGGSVYRLTTADEREFSAPDAETLTEQALGWRLPLAGLPDWVRGRPAPGSPAQVERDAQGRPARLRQDEWLIGYEAWEGGLPSRLLMERGELRIRLLVEAWTDRPGERP